MYYCLYLGRRIDWRCSSSSLVGELRGVLPIGRRRTFLRLKIMAVLGLLDFHTRALVTSLCTPPYRQKEGGKDNGEKLF